MAGSSRSVRHASMPLIPGIITSSTTRSGGSAWQASTAATPSPTAVTS